MTINGCCTGRAALDVGGLVLVTPNYANVFTVNGNTSVQDVLLVGSDIGGTSLRVRGTASMTGLTTSTGVVLIKSTNFCFRVACIFNGKL